MKFNVLLLFYREDGKDSMEMYSVNPNRLTMLKDTEQIFYDQKKEVRSTFLRFLLKHSNVISYLLCNNV